MTGNMCWARFAWLGAALLLAVGCGRADRPRFVLNFEGKERTAAVREERKAMQTAHEALSTALTAAFGTPDDPFVFPETGLDLDKIRIASGPYSSDQHGRQRGLYRQHCAHCHGITGDGAGPTAAFLSPYPRDYRRGIFKYKSTERTAKPTHADLAWIIKQGITGTAMPAFGLLPESEVEALAEYVR